MSTLTQPTSGPHALRAQVIAELRMRLTHGETALLVLGIPITLLLFFSLVDVVDVPTETNVEFVFPGILALAVLSTAFTSTAIATAFERAYGVLKRVGATPLGRTRLILAKIIAIAATQVVQVVVLTAIAASLGFTSINMLDIVAIIAAGTAATSACVGIALVLASTLRPEAVLGVANGIYVLLLLLSGLVFELDRLPDWLATVSQLLPVTALAEIYRAVLTTEATSIGSRPIVVLTVWACAAPLVARRMFKWS
jgi:ABC-2 type transport system permease protein